MTDDQAASKPPVGMLADEAAQLLDAVAAKLIDYRAAPADSPGPTPSAGDDTQAVDGAPVHTCVGWCPICRSADLIRGDRSEVIAKLLDAALVMVTTLRSLIGEPVGGTESVPRGSAAPGSSRPPGIERIDIR